MVELLTSSQLAQRIVDVATLGSSKRSPLHFVVAISGPDCVGKTTIASEVIRKLESASIEGDLLSVDDYLIPRIQRDGLPDESTNYFERGFDYARLRGTVAEAKAAHTRSPAVIVVEGVFLLRRDLLDLWDLTVWLDTDDETIVSRGVARDSEYFGGASEAKRAYDTRMLPAQALHRRKDLPATTASISSWWDGGVWRSISEPQLGDAKQE